MTKFKQNGAAHVNFDFPPQTGIGIAQLIKHTSAQCLDLLIKMLLYDASERISAREALRHAYFTELRDLDTRKQFAHPAAPQVLHDSPEKDEAGSSTQGKGLPTIGGNVPYSNTLSNSNTKKGAKITPKDLAVFPWEKAAHKKKPQLDGRRMLESLVKYSK